VRGERYICSVENRRRHVDAARRWSQAVARRECFGGKRGMRATGGAAVSSSGSAFCPGGEVRSPC
jgi:hypothetical protein